MARPLNPQTPPGLILPWADAQRVLQDPKLTGKATGSFGHGRFTWYPFQRTVLNSLCDEIGQFGGAGGGKSHAMRAWLIKGNPELPAKHPDGTPIMVNISYMYHPGYHGLILRKNQEDLDEFISRSIGMYKPYGIEFVNGQFRHPCGAVIDCGHMKDRNAWQKYLGIEFTRIAIDEAPLIPDEASYEELRTRSLRTVYPELRTQILLAGNAGGPGTSWIATRFMDVRCGYDSEREVRIYTEPALPDGSPIPRGQIIYEEHIHPVTGKKESLSRVWVFSTLRDNPIFANSSYAVRLKSTPDKKRRAAYLDGDWQAFTGAYFGDVWRAQGRTGEPKHAVHVLSAKTAPKLESWFNRSAAIDWGYRHEAVATWLCQHGVTGQIHIYREMATSQTSAERFGYEFALASLADINQASDHSLTLHLSHDAFQQRDQTHTIVELIAMGIARVVGTNAVHIPDLVIKRLHESYQTGPFPSPQEERERNAAMEALRQQKFTGITIRIAPKTNSIGWQYVRELMRWEPIQSNRPFFDPELAMRLRMEDEGKFQDYLHFTRDIPDEILPKLQIWDTCPKLIAAIPKLQYDLDMSEDIDKSHFPGRDSIDSAFYCLLGHRDSKGTEPWEAFRGRALNEALALNPDLSCQDLIWHNRHLEAEWQNKMEGPVSFSPNRGGRARRRPDSIQ